MYASPSANQHNRNVVSAVMRLPQRQDGSIAGIVKWLGTAPQSGVVVRKRDSHATLDKLTQRCQAVTAGAAGSGLAVALVVHVDGTRAAVTAPQLASLVASLQSGRARGIEALQIQSSLPAGVRVIVEAQLTAHGMVRQTLRLTPA